MRLLPAGALARLDAGDTMPFALMLESSGQGVMRRFECLEVLRLLPGRRVVLRAGSDGAAVVLKLFIGRGRHRYLGREKRGLDRLAGARVPVADVVDQVSGEGITGLVLRYLPDARPVETHDQQRMEEIAGLLGKMHSAGVWHADLHLDNFVVSADCVHAIDGDGVRRRRGRVSRTAGLKNLAVLAAQRPPSADDAVGGLLEHYRRQDCEAVNQQEFHTFLLRARRQRVRRYVEKTQRSCSEFRVSKHWRAWTFAVTGRGEAPLETLARDPDAVFRDGRILKAGNSATLAELSVAEPLVVKRFNIKSARHGLRRMLRATPRFRRAWICGQVLRFLEIPTARPLALLECRFGPWRGVAYLVMEKLDGPDLAREISDKGLTDSRCREVADLFGLLKTAGLSHGDAKATNFVIHDDRVHLIDLDAMQLNPRGFRRDLERFMSNWEPPEQARFKTAFVAAGLL